MTLPRAFITHQVPGRARVRVPAMSKNSGYFRQCARRLSEQGNVSFVHVNPLTASILIHYEGSLAPVERAAHDALLFELVRSDEQPLLSRRLYDRFYGYADQLERASGGRWDVSGMAMVVLMSLACVQFARGRVLPAGWTMLWHASNLLREVPQVAWTERARQARHWSKH